MKLRRSSGWCFVSALQCRLLLLHIPNCIHLVVQKRRIADLSLHGNRIPMSRKPKNDVDNDSTCVIHQRDPRRCKPRGTLKDRYHCMFNIINAWLDHCFESHSECSKSLLPETQSSIVPTRLIDVGFDSPAKEPRLVRYGSMQELLQATQSARYPGYATLSYCWGKDHAQHYLLREENETEYLNEIPIASLPRTINETIKICRRLGIQCLWIDALCILQNPGGPSLDWQKESARVGIYYNNAMVTIADCWASNNNEGCLPQGQWLAGMSMLRSYTKTAIQRACEAIADKSLRQLQSINPKRIHDMKRTDTEVEQSALLNRGWVAQEIAFSSRVLWFTESGVFWQCAQYSKSDRGSDFLNQSMTSMKRENVWIDHRLDPRHAHWYLIAAHYAGMSLSHETDRLPALSGLCKFVDSDNKDEYLAGLWRSSLLFGLSWYADGDGAPQNENMPSWSWISRNQQIEFEGDSLCPNPDCEVGSFELMDSDIQLSYGDTHGQIEHARIRIKAPLQRLETLRKFESVLFRTPDTACSWEERFPSLRFDRFGRDTLLRVSSWSGCAILLSHSCEVDRNADRELAIALLVEPLEQEGSTYRRVGLLSIHHLYRESDPSSVLDVNEFLKTNFGRDDVKEVTLG